jgi:ubiquinone/menaquinone biosynthesis C-methylase UbiE
LDFGSGTGNLTGKLLSLEYQVTAVDISPEMCTTLRSKFKKQIQQNQLKIINSPIEDVKFSSEQFDLITCYSVLHHLPDYENTLSRLCDLLKKGGVIYIDHEASPYYWNNEATMLAEIIKSLYLHSNPLLNSIYFQITSLKIPNLDYTLSDYWHKKDHALSHNKIQFIFQRKKFELAQRIDYNLRGTWIPNPLYPLYRLICRPEMSCWTAKK